MTSLASPRIERVEPEPPRIAAGVEHRASGAERGQVAAVVALIAEEARLVAPLELDAVADAVLVDRHAGRREGAGQGPAREVFGQGDPLVDVDPDVLRAQRIGHQGEDRADPLVHPQAEELGRQDVVEAVDDQAREAVSLGVEDPVRVGDPVEAEHLAAEGDRPLDPPLPEVRTRRMDALRQQPQADLRAAIPEAEPDRQVVAVDHAHEVAVGGPDAADRADHHLPIDERVVPRGANRHDGEVVRGLERPVGQVGRRGGFRGTAGTGDHRGRSAGGGDHRSREESEGSYSMSSASSGSASSEKSLRTIRRSRTSKAVA